MFAITPPGAGELMIILVIILLIFGGAKLPQLARSLGQAQKEFKRGQSEDLDDEGEKPSTSSSSRDDA